MAIATRQDAYIGGDWSPGDGAECEVREMFDRISPARETPHQKWPEQVELLFDGETPRVLQR